MHKKMTTSWPNVPGAIVRKFGVRITQWKNARWPVLRFFPQLSASATYPFACIPWQQAYTSNRSNGMLQMREEKGASRIYLWANVQANQVLSHFIVIDHLDITSSDPERGID
jgi:hypothetical protein